MNSLECLTITRKEQTAFMRCLKAAERYRVPYTTVLPRDVYDVYYSRKFRHLIATDFIGIIEQHKDTYIHCTKREIAEQIIRDGYLRVNTSLDVCTIGKAVYTFPLGAGRFYDSDGLVAIVFTTDAEHIHIVDDSDSRCDLGEADFIEDVRLDNYKVVSLEEALELIAKAWDPVTALVHYYGFKREEINSNCRSLSMEQLPIFIEDKVINYSAFKPREDFKNLHDVIKHGHFNLDQRRQIELGLAGGLDVSIYAKPEFNFEQMSVIREGLERGFDVSIYAKPEFKAKQMYQVFCGLIEGVNVSVYANAQFNVGQMREILRGLRDGIDISEYALRGFRSDQLGEIRRGLIDGVDVSTYADLKLNWSQMETIRKELTINKTKGKSASSILDDISKGY